MRRGKKDVCVTLIRPESLAFSIYDVYIHRRYVLKFHKVLTATFYRWRRPVAMQVQVPGSRGNAYIVIWGRKICKSCKKSYLR